MNVSRADSSDARVPAQCLGRPQLRVPGLRVHQVVETIDQHLQRLNVETAPALSILNPLFSTLRTNHEKDDPDLRLGRFRARRRRGLRQTPAVQPGAAATVMKTKNLCEWLRDSDTLAWDAVTPKVAADWDMAVKSIASEHNLSEAAAARKLAQLCRQQLAQK